MGVASHLGIDLQEYDARIRTFIPYYDEMLHCAAGAISPRTRTILDLGTGTGALAAACLRKARKARVVGIDADAGMLQLAAKRLGKRAELYCQTFDDAQFPAADAIVASLSLHHIPTRQAKRRTYSRIAAALKRGGTFVNVDCCPANNPRSQAYQRQFDEWARHLRLTYSARETKQLFQAWSHEDFYLPLSVELELMQTAGLAAEILYRRGPFAVVIGKM